MHNTIEFPRALRRLPPLNSLRVFVVAAKHANFTLAAQELHVTPGAVSQQIKQLEGYLGRTLFRRTSQALVLTDEGRACLPGLIEAFALMQQSIAAVEKSDRAGILSVSVAPSFASKWLVPRLDRFQSLHPEIDVRVSASVSLVDFESDDIDCAIRYGDGHYAGLFVERLLSESVGPVCNPALLSGNALRTPADLANQTLIHDDSPDRDPSCPDWGMWLRAAGVAVRDAARGLRFNQSALVLEAAIAGRGVALAKVRLATADVKAGRLIHLFRPKQPVAFAYYFVCPRSAFEMRKVRVFKEWLIEQARESDEPRLSLLAPTAIRSKSRSRKFLSRRNRL